MSPPGLFSPWLFFFKRQWRLIAVFTGLALATKHSALFLYPIYLIYLVPEFLKKPSFKVFLKYLLTFILIPLLIYFLSYSPMFLQGKTWTDFVNLHKQIYYYQTHLTATHGYQSVMWQWYAYPPGLVPCGLFRRQNCQHL